MDALSDILKSIRLTSTVYFRKDFPAPWGMVVPESPVASFHFVLRGVCNLKVSSETKIRLLSSGDVVCFPHGNAHWIADDPESKKVNGRKVLQNHNEGKTTFQGQKPGATLICGHFAYDRNIHPLFIKSLPNVILLSVHEHIELAWLETVLNTVLLEVDSERPGSDIVALRLSEALFIQLLQICIKKQEADYRPVNGPNFLVALGDEQIGRVLNSMHSKPSFPWELESLAQNAPMSRSALAARFKELTGMSPMHYLTRWRMYLARELLLQSQQPLIDIAEQVGFGSEAAFSRAFKRIIGENPGTVRRQSRKNIGIDGEE